MDTNERDCPACGSSTFGRFLRLVTRCLPDSTGCPDPVVDVELTCERCQHIERLQHDVQLATRAQITVVRETLEAETGLPVVIAPPDDPPAGVREPRRSPPGGDTLAVQLEPPPE